MIVGLVVLWLIGWFSCEYIIFPILGEGGFGFLGNIGIYLLAACAILITFILLGLAIYAIVLLYKCVYSSCKDACKDAKLRSELYSIDLNDTNDNEEPLEINVEV
jgi:predicted membrane protein